MLELIIMMMTYFCNQSVKVTSVCTMPCLCSLIVLTTSEMSN